MREKITEPKWRHETNVLENQFGFMPEIGKWKLYTFLRLREKKRDLDMVFINWEKTYDRVPR